MAKKYRSDAFAAIHEAVEALHDIGAINKHTMREFDEACLNTAPLNPKPPAQAVCVVPEIVRRRYRLPWPQ